jgi:hypothetical protein
MTISTYAELQTAIADWVKKSDISATTIRDFITLAESKINRVARLNDQATVTTITMTTALAYNSLPSDFLEISDYYYGATKEQLTQLSVRAMSEKLSTSSGRPDYYAITSRIDYERTPDAAYTCILPYFKKWDLATNTATTQLLISHPGAYLYGSLAEAGAWLIDDPRVALWKSLAAEVLDELNTLSARTRAKAPLRMPYGMVSGYRGDINAGE